MPDEIAVLIEIQNKLLTATQEKTLAEIESANKAQELIEKREESIKLSKELIDSNREIIENVKSLMKIINSVVKDLEPLDLLINKIDVLILLTQLTIQVISKLNGIDKEHVEKMNENLIRLGELLAQRNVTIHTIGSIDAKQANVGNDVSGKQGE